LEWQLGKRGTESECQLSHLTLPAVQGGMTHFMKRPLVILPSVVWLSMVSACGPQVDVLNDMDAGAGSASAATGGATTGGTSSAGNASDSAATSGGGVTSICTAFSRSTMDVITTGQACSNSDMCGPGGCAVMTGSADGTESAFGSCRHGQAIIMRMSVLDKLAAGRWTPRNDGVSWTDCNAALASGLSGQACTFPTKTCARTTSDSCCIEGAQCTLRGNDTLLERIRICAPGCTSLTPVSTAPVVTDCASITAEDACHNTLPCQGNFICWGKIDSALPVVPFSETNGLDGVMWCAGGSIVGGYSFVWGV
jgi:hypothetical protein